MNAVTPITSPRPALVAGGRPAAIIPQSMDEAYRLADAICQAGMAPRGLDTPPKAMIAIMQGLEVGLTPLAALQRIAVVNGRPTIWGDGAVGLVRGSGLCEYIEEKISGAGDQRFATCEAKRKGERGPVIRTFSVADAKTAGLWGKSGPWQQYPDRMLAMRARAFALRDGFADVLGGMYLREEIDDAPVETPPSPTSSYGARPIASAPPAAQLSPPSPSASEQPTPPEESVFDRIMREIAEAKTTADLDASSKANAGEFRKLPQDQREKIMAAANARYDALDTQKIDQLTPPSAASQGESLANSNPEAWIAECERRMAECSDIDALRELWECVIAPESEGAFPSDIGEVKKAFDRHEARLGNG